MSTLPNRNLPLPARVRKAREFNGLSQERFATAAGLTRRHVIRIENGTTKSLLPATASRMSAALGLPDDFFIDVDDDAEAASMEPVSRAMYEDLRARLVEAHQVLGEVLA